MKVTKDAAFQKTWHLKFKPQLHMLWLPLVCGLIVSITSHAQQSAKDFAWPEGKSVALSLSFDDARLSQVDEGLAFLDKYGVKATFFVVPAQVEERLEGWKQAVRQGHEIGNHTLTHPCSGNYPFARQKALEDYDLERMKHEVLEANKEIERLLGVRPTVFAYPCGQTFVGRGAETDSYVPLVAENFFVGRTYRDAIGNDPAFCDFAQVTGIDMDGKTFKELRAILERARANNQWVVLGGHEMGDSGRQTTRLSMLKKLMKYAEDPKNGVWIAPVGEVAGYIQKQRK